MKFRITNQNHIKKLLQNGIQSQQVSEMMVELENPEIFIESLLDELNEESDWPLAVNPALIVDTNNESECIIRAKNIVDMIVERDLYGLKILDFGCGDGLVAGEMLSRGASKVVAYDLRPHKFWNLSENVQFTTTAQDVASNGPYDFILLYDVIDHIMNVEPSIVLTDLKTLLAIDGIITMRCHPWITRHGAHLYTQINRAFLHLIFSDEQLRRRGYDPINTRKIVHPILMYKKWIEKAGLKIVKEDKIVEPVEDYFTKNELLRELIYRHFKDSPIAEYREGKGDLSRVLSFHFVDYILKK